MVPSYANFGGKVHGGTLMSLMDKVAYVCASKHAGNYCVTVSVDNVEFLQPVEVGEVIKLMGSVNYVGRKSLVVGIKVVAENLQEVYPRLTGGGTARLSLTNEEDLLETGVEIFVQPPGKRLQNLALLSGGEKAMTAIAMLFALFQVKPSPFCVLDEVDAPLDEANGGRFNEVVKEMAALAQFILITHNRKTMEAADTLYGVTMPTPGVSRLVSVRLEA